MARPRIVNFPCIKCGEASLICYYSRLQGNVRVRHIRCAKCGYKFFYYEGKSRAFWRPIKKRL